MLDEDTLETIRACLKQAPIAAPASTDRVYKEECAFSFDTSLSDGGLFLNLKTWLSYGADFVQLDHALTGNKLYLHEKARKIPIVEDKRADRPDKLAIGGDGGFQVGGPKYTVERQQWLTIVPEGMEVLLPAPELPDMILNTIAAISVHESASVQEATSAWEEERAVSRYAADLPQLEEGMGRFGRTVPSSPEAWTCDETGVRENLWLNLSTGFIGSGRQNYDGSGGNGAAERHFEATGRQFPLAVKLGTITPNGADVFSYAEDDMVTDPKLAEHLAHWGINMLAMQKTVKTMTELQIDLNLAYEHEKITEAGSSLQPLSGPGYIGLENLGNSCYMNSILQMLWSIPSIQQRYADAAASGIFQSAPADPVADFPAQMAKVGVALCQGRTGQPAAAQPGSDAMDASPTQTQSVRPQAFKSLIGKGHHEFSSMRQQDASEFFQHLLNTMTRAERAGVQRLGKPGEGLTAAAFEYGIETRVQCGESGRVSYKRDAPTNVLSLNVPLEAAANRDAVEEYQEREAKRAKLRESNADAYIQQDNGIDHSQVISKAVKEQKVLPQVPLSACLEKWAADEEMGDYYSAALGRKTKALKRQRIANFPPFLVVQLNRFYMASDWTSKKLEVLVDVPEQIDLESLRGRGLQPSEQLQPEAPAAEPAAPPPEVLQPDPQIVEALTGMGFSENGSKRAAVATKNVGTEASMDWVLSHMQDPDFNEPLPTASSSLGPAYKPDPESLVMLTSMGFTDRQATAALKTCQGSLERAADWLFSHASELDQAVEAALVPDGQSAQPCTSAPQDQRQGAAPQDGHGKYELVGFVSHMGANTACGHYVAHLRKEGRWVIFNDEKVAVSENPPKDLGYLYLFQRTS